MKTIKILIIALLLTGCSKSDNEINCVLDCQNGATLNIATCECNCPVNYTGNNCSTEVQPTSIKITNVKLTNFPLLDSAGEFFDYLAVGNNVYPDIFIGLEQIGGQGLITSEIYYENVSNIEPLNFQMNLTISNVTDNWIIGVYDYDGGDFDSMAQYVFQPYIHGEGFPEIIVVTDASTFRAELTLMYNW